MLEIGFMSVKSKIRIKECHYLEVLLTEAMKWMLLSWSIMFHIIYPVQKRDIVKQLQV